jgi:hypothetical protein
MSKFEESRIQEAIVKRFNELVLYKQIKPALLYSNRNENKGLISGARYKRQGRVAGVPDLTLIWYGGFMYIEVKTPSAHRTTKGIETKSKGMSEDQILFHENYIKPFKIPFEVVSSIADFENAIWFLK